MIQRETALQHLLDLLTVEGLSGREKPVADAIKAKLISFGAKPEWMRFDDAAAKIPGDYECGNFIVQLPGTREGKRLMFSGHMDTVPVTKGAIPRVEGNRIVSQEDCGLGADNRTAVACLVSLAEVLLTHKDADGNALSYPPITLLFTVGEEVGLWGARYVQLDDLGHPAMGFNYDAGDPNSVTIGALGADRWVINIHGISSHAGVHPDHGVSATNIAAKAIASLHDNGWLGRVEKDGKLGTGNVGIIQGGQATNEINKQVYIKGESRSHDGDFLNVITAKIKATFEAEAAAVSNHEGKTGRIEWKQDRDYEAFCIPDDAPVIAHTLTVAKTIGLDPFTKSVDGGLDANYLNTHGVPTVTLGAGQHGAHTVDEYADIDEYIKGCELAVALATV